MPYPNASLVRSPDIKTIEIKTKKQERSSFTQEEKIEMRKRVICFKNTALIVAKGILTEEAIDHCTVPVMVDLKMAEVQTNKDCECKDNNFYWSSRITCDERKKVLKVCAELWGESKKVEKASELMSIFHLETADTFSPSKENGKGYVGLIQFDESAANSVGTTYAKLKVMTFIDQLVYVEKYLQKNKDKLTTLTDFYLQVIKPNAVGNGSDPNYVVFDERISVPDNGIEPNLDKRKKNIQREPWVTKYGYASNHIFMKENGEYLNKRQAWHYTSQANVERRGFVNGKTTIKEIKQVVMKDHYEPGKSSIFLGSCKNDGQISALSDRAPWMEIVLSEAKKYGGYYEGDDTKLSKRIKAEYFTVSNEATTSKSDPTKISWCAVFASWCLQKAGYANPSKCRALEFVPGYVHEGPGKEDKKISHMRKISKPVYGCIIVWKNKSGGGGHVAFYYGKTVDGNIIPIGGNQGSSLQFSKRNPNGDTKQEIIGYFLPEDYTDNPADEFTKTELKLDPILLNKSELLAKNGFVSTST